MAALPNVKSSFFVSPKARLSSPIPPLPPSKGILCVGSSARLTVELSLSAKTQLLISTRIVRRSTSARISELSQQLIAENIIALFEIDLTKFGSDYGIARFVPDLSGDMSPVRWGGNPYFPVPVQASGFEKGSTGAQARPMLSISNVSTAISALIIEGQDLVGCTVRRIRTFTRFLDDGLEPDSTQNFIPEVYRISRKASHNKAFVEFELASILDQEGTMLPRRQVVRDYCAHVYRFYDSGAEEWRVDVFDPCPYSGPLYHDKNGNVVAEPSGDFCGKRIRDCKLRFGANGRLPFRGFPGVGRF